MHGDPKRIGFMPGPDQCRTTNARNRRDPARVRARRSPQVKAHLGRQGRYLTESPSRSPSARLHPAAGRDVARHAAAATSSDLSYNLRTCLEAALAQPCAGRRAPDLGYVPHRGRQKQKKCHIGCHQPPADWASRLRSAPGSKEMSKNIPLTFTCWNYDRMRGIQDGEVTIEGVDLTFLAMEMPESFFRMLHYGDFEASEMSLSWYTRTFFSEPRPFVAIPVFPSRMFRHSCIYVNTDSGITSPADLIGKRVGVPEYQMTAAVWIRGILADHYGVPVNSMTYFTGGLEEPGRTEVALDLPADIHVVPIGDQRTLSRMLADGELDALYTAHMPSCYEQKTPNVRRLFEDYEAEEKKYFRETGIFPIMHTVVIRTDVLERHPWVAASLLEACERSKQLVYKELFEPAAPKYTLPWLMAAAEATREVFGVDDFWPYGFDSNRETLSTFLRYSHEQGLIPHQPEPEELFFPSTLRTAKK